MGTFIGHLLPGAGFMAIGLWHLLNTILNYGRAGPWEFHTRAWFPVKGKLKYAELVAIMVGSCLSISAELFICPARHQPLADDWSIPPEHLNNFEHSSISLFFLIYAGVALYVEIGKVESAPKGLVHVAAALAFSQELLLFHLHSADHMGLEGQYHWLLQLVVVVSLSCTLLEIPFPRSFEVAMVRSMSILFQGVWFVNMAFMLWIPAFIPKGCHNIQRHSHSVIICGSEQETMRAKALANLQFTWFLASIVLLTFVLYLRIAHPLRTAQTHRYQPLAKDVENADCAESPASSVEMGAFNDDRLDLER